MMTGTDLGVPESYGGNGNFCVCTISVPGYEPVVAYKSIKDRGQPDEWTVNCTKTLGRALKKCGYPDDLKDLKALVLWRQRDAEITAIRGGFAVEAPSNPLEIEAGGRDVDDDDQPDADHDVIDEADTTMPPADSRGHETDINSDDSNVVDAEVIEDEATPEPRDEERLAALLTEIRDLPQTDKDDFKVWLVDQNISSHPDGWTDANLDEIDAWMAND
jgi:hypothetical protein